VDLNAAEAEQGPAENRGMSKSKSKWKNRDGKTVKSNTLAEQWSSRPVGLLESPAFRILSKAEHLALSRIEIELRHHGGYQNGKLIVTTEQFVDYGIERRSVPGALRALSALGIVLTKHGRGGNAKYWQPNTFLLNYLCGAIDAHEQITDAWKIIETIEQAEEIASMAHAAKDPNRVAYGQRIARKTKNISQVQKMSLPGTETVPRRGDFPSTETVPPCRGTETVPTIDTRGRGDQLAIPPEDEQPHQKPNGDDGPSFIQGLQ
jgi:hypothetical protein